MDDATDPRRVLRAGDVERAHVGRLLSEAYAEGRLTLDEYRDRSERALASTYLAQLDELLTDLGPSGALERMPAASVPVSAAVEGDKGIPLSLAIMSGVTRAGRWRTSQDHVAIAFWGGVEIDLREATFDSPRTTIWAVAIMGAVVVKVPPFVAVQIEGLPIMGGFGMEGGAVNPVDLPADAPLVTIRGFAFWGGVGVERKGYHRHNPPELEE